MDDLRAFSTTVAEQEVPDTEQFDEVTARMNKLLEACNRLKDSGEMPDDLARYFVRTVVKLRQNATEVERKWVEDISQHWKRR
jgi:hypothetical protein